MTRRNQIKQLLGLGALGVCSASDSDATTAPVQPKALANVVGIGVEEESGIPIVQYEAASSLDSFVSSVQVSSFSRVQLVEAIQADAVIHFAAAGETFDAATIFVLI